MSIGPKKGWKVAGNLVSPRTATNKSILTSFLEPGGIQTKPEIEHPPCDLSRRIAARQVSAGDEIRFDSPDVLICPTTQPNDSSVPVHYEVAYSRPKRVQETAKTKGCHGHEDGKLGEHGAQGEDQEVVGERHKGQPVDLIRQVRIMGGGRTSGTSSMLREPDSPCLLRSPIALKQVSDESKDREQRWHRGI